MLAESIPVEKDVRQLRSRKIERRQLHDVSYPLELSQSLFQKNYRVNKSAFRNLLEVLTKYSQKTKKKFAAPTIAKLSGCMRFFAEGGYQTGIGKDCDVHLVQSTFSVKTAEEKREIALAFHKKHKIPGVIGCIDGTHVK